MIKNGVNCLGIRLKNKMTTLDCLNSRLNEINKICNSTKIKEINSLQRQLNNSNIAKISKLFSESCGTKYLNQISNIFPVMQKINKQYFSLPFDVYSNVYSKLLYDNYNFTAAFFEKSENEQIEITLKNKDEVGLRKLFSTITKEEAEKFVDFIWRTPLLGFKDPNRTGEKIFNELEKKFNNNLETISKGKKLYRVRIWEKEMQSDFTGPQMFERPFGMGLYGRYDCFGENPLYMAEDIKTSLCEIKDEQSSKTGICAELKYDAKILDMSSENIIFELCNKQKQTGRINEYIMPNFISECCKLIAHNNGIQLDGLKYKSSIHSNGVNYVFFDFGKGHFTDLKIIKNEELNKIEV